MTDYVMMKCGCAGQAMLTKLSICPKNSADFGQIECSQEGGEGR